MTEMACGAKCTFSNATTDDHCLPVPRERRERTSNAAASEDDAAGHRPGRQRTSAAEAEDVSDRKRKGHRKPINHPHRRSKLNAPRRPHVLCVARRRMPPRQQVGAG